MRHEQLFGVGEDFFVDQETGRVDNFIKRYVEAIGGPLVLRNHAGDVDCLSSHRYCDVRSRGLLSHLENTQAKLDVYEWGRTIFSEILFADLIRTIYAKRFARLGYSVVLSPYTLDASQQNPYQKGVDIVVVNTRKRRGNAIGSGVCGIDVTLGNQLIMDCKLARPGFQARTAMPALVVPIKQILAYFGDDGTEVLTRFDSYGRRSVRALGYPTVLYGMSQEDYHCWRRGVAFVLQTSIGWCKSGLQAHWGTHLTEYPHARHVMNLISECEGLFKL